MQPASNTQLVEHMGLRGVFTSQIRQAFADSPVLNNAVAMNGNPKQPFLPLGYNHAKPRQSQRQVAEMLATTTSNQSWLRNHARGPGLNTNTAQLHPPLVAPYEMARRGMGINTLPISGNPVYRPTAEAVAQGQVKKGSAPY